MTARASILHADLDAFYASVEQRDSPSLRGKPVIVGGGVVLAASYEAKARGVRTAMGGRQAKRVCPEAIEVPARMSAYSEASAAVFKIFRDMAPVVEALSIDEAFLDVSGLEHISGTPKQIAATLRRRVLEEAGLPITVGIARTKFLAKVASGVAKPDGLLVVEPEEEMAFLHPLPVERLWGVGKVTSKKLHEIGVWTVGDIALCDEQHLIDAVGAAAGRKLHDLAHNIDPREVRTRKPRNSIGAQSAFGRRQMSPGDLDALALALTDRVMGRLRKAGRECRTVVVRLRFGDYTRATRSHTLDRRTAQTAVVVDAVRDLLEASAGEIASRGLTLLGIALENLESAEAALQLTLPLERDSTALDKTLDEVRDRFGKRAITRAVLLQHDEGVSVPILPD